MIKSFSMNFVLLLLSLLVMSMNFFIPKEVNFIILCIIIFFFAHIDTRNIIKSITVTWPILIMVLLGCINGYDNDNSFLLKDLFYFSKILIYFIGGVILSKYVKDLNTFFSYFILFALASIGKHLILFFSNYQALSFIELRAIAGTSSIIEVIFLSMVFSRLLNKDFNQIFDKFKFAHLIIAILATLSFALYFSRTMFVNLIVLTLFLSNKLNIRKKISKVYKQLAFVSLFIVLLIFLKASFIPQTGTSDSFVNTLVQKFENVPQEVYWDAQKNNSATLAEINENWRGYEAYQGILMYNSGNLIQKLFGFGFGSLVDLGIIIDLDGNDFENVPFLHNGYITLLIKGGVVFLFFYFLFLYKIGFTSIKIHNDLSPEIYSSYQILSAISVVTLLSSFSNMGLTNPACSVEPILFGYFWGTIERKRVASFAKRVFIRPEIVRG